MKMTLHSLAAPLLFISMTTATLANATAQERVDQAFEAVQAAASEANLTEVIAIDHARLAAEAGVEMPAARVQIFSDPSVNSAILSAQIRAGVDLPLRVLAYDEMGDTRVSYTSAAFLAQRHGLKASPALEGFDARFVEVLSGLDALNPQPVPVENLTKDFGLIELQSAHDVAQTVARLKATVTAQPDTIWFGEIDYQAEAAIEGVDLPPATLLLFGGPAPGGVAMAQYPAIGLDAFCQKLLVYQNNNGKTLVIYNDIAAMAEYYYASTIKEHGMLNQRLTATFSEAIK